MRAGREISPKLPLLLSLLLLPLGFGEALAQCDFEPDSPDCACFDDTGVWDPGGAFIQDVAAPTVGTRESCLCPGVPGCDWDPDPLDPDVNFANSGKPYYQMVLGCPEPFDAFSMAILLDGGASLPGRGAWCTETVAFWHKHTYIPYPGGYRNDWHADWQVYAARDLMEWYAHEELLDDGRGRWIASHEIDYDDFELGVTVPVPGAYIAIRDYQRGYPDTWMSWRDTGHSLIVDEMWVHTGAGGEVFKITVSLLEGNSQNRVRDDRTPWDDVLALTTQGAEWIGSNRKIFGFGIDLDAAGDPIYDERRLHWVHHPYHYTMPSLALLAALDPEWNEQRFLKTQVYAELLREAGGPAVETSSPDLQLDGLPDAQTVVWQFPVDTAEELVVDVDLRYSYPLPIRGLELRWDVETFPYGYGVEYAGADQNYQIADVYDPGNLPLPPGMSTVPIPVRFTQTEEGVEVRFVRLTFPAGTLMDGAVLHEMRFDYDIGDIDDAPENPIGTTASPDCSTAYAEPAVLWPPNHKLHEVRIAGIVDEEGTPPEMFMAAVTQDEPLDDDGDGTSEPDAFMNGSTVLIRAERSGEGNGRMIEVHYVAMFDDGVFCRGTVDVAVPLDRDTVPVDDGQLYEAVMAP